VGFKVSGIGLLWGTPAELRQIMAHGNLPRKLVTTRLKEDDTDVRRCLSTGGMANKKKSYLQREEHKGKALRGGGAILAVFKKPYGHLAVTAIENRWVADRCFENNK